MDFLLEFAQKNGYAIAWGNIDVLDEIELEMQSRNQEFSKFQKQFFGTWESIKSSKIKNMKTVIVVSFPVNELNKAILNFDNKTVNVVIPAGYKNAKGKYKVVYDKLKETLDLNSISCVEIQPPLKNLSTRIGLAEYGRNNVTYVDGFGSYHAMIGVACDRTFKPEFYPKKTVPQRMEQCENCNLCIKACSSHAITKDNFMIDMEKCVTLYNEADITWPEWLNVKLSKYLIGCASCQLCCPKNKGLLIQNEPYEFCVEETMAIINDAPKTDIAWGTIANKLDDIGLTGFETAVFNNIKMIYSSTNE